MTEAPITKTQIRALAVLGLQPAQGYKEAGESLTAASAPFDGIPYGHNWRSAAKLSDDELRAALAVEDPRRPGKGKRKWSWIRYGFNARS